MEEKRAEAQERQERIEQAVENYSFRPQVEIDRERVQRDTAAREMRRGLEFDEADKVRLYKNDGYTADKLMSDVRYKISAALHAAGAHNTTYGH